MKQLRVRVIEALQRDPNCMSQVTSEWAGYTSNLLTQHAASSEIARQEIKRLLGSSLSKDRFAALEEIDRRLSVISDKSWEKFFAAIVRTGYDIAAIGLSIDGKSIRHRNPPPIYFENLPRAREFIQGVLSPGGSNNSIGDQLRAVDDQDKTGYSKLLAFAVLFAYAGRWYVALLIAQHAAQLAERIVAERNNFNTGISGREAYYFCAVAKRISARSLSDLEDVDEWLDKAEEALERDIKRPENPSSVDSLRFRSERAALRLSRTLFRKFDARSPLDSVPDHELVALFEHLRSILADSSGSKIEWIRKNVERHSLTNIFMTASLLVEQQIANNLIDEKELEKAAEYWMGMGLEEQGSTKGDNSIPLVETTLVKAVRVFALARYANPTLRVWRQLRLELQAVESVVFSMSEQLLPYDRKRFEHLFERTAKALGSRRPKY